MPESYFRLSVRDKADALNAASAVSGRPPHLLEKDIWVVWSLAALFESQFGSRLVFKGGTALSKAYTRHVFHCVASPSPSQREFRR